MRQVRVLGLADGTSDDTPGGRAPRHEALQVQLVRFHLLDEPLFETARQGGPREDKGLWLPQLQFQGGV